jgi:hypothetical protein
MKKNKGTRRMIKMKGGQEEEEEKENCPKCFGVYNDENPGITLTCNHKFHKSCMKSACEASSINGPCLCPLCRKELSQEELEEIGIEDEPSEISNDDPPILDTIDQFKGYINNKLMRPTMEPLVVLNNELSKFLFTHSLPFDLIGDIMEFQFQPIDGLHRYQLISVHSRYEFERDHRSVPVNRLNRKYFAYDFNGDDGSAFHESSYIAEF